MSGGSRNIPTYRSWRTWIGPCSEGHPGTGGPDIDVLEHYSACVMTALTAVLRVVHRNAATTRVGPGNSSCPRDSA